MFADEGRVHEGIPRLDHVFVIMMENHSYSQILNNPNAPFANALARSANTATNYFAIAHPSLTNYLEVVGGSNFGVPSDNNPDWHNAVCATNLSVSNSLSGRGRKLDQVPAVGDPTHEGPVLPGAGR